MDPDLVGATRGEPNPHQIARVEPGDRLDMRARRPPGGQHGHALAVLGMSRDRGIDVDRLPEMAPHQHSVEPQHLTAGDRVRETPVRLVGLSHHQQARRVLVEPVDDPGPATRSRGERRAAGDQRIQQGVAPVARSRMNHESRGLVEHEHRVVFVHNGKLYVVRFQFARGLLIAQFDLDRISPTEDLGGASRRAVDANRLTGDQSRRLRA